MAKQAKKRRIVVTGMGVVSCLGHDVDFFYRALLDGKSGISTITEFPCDQFPTRFAGVIHAFDPGEYLDKKQARRVDKFISYGVVAAKKAMENAGFTQEVLTQLDKKKCGVIIGSGMGGMSVFSDGVMTVAEKGVSRLTPFFVPYILSNMAGALVAMDLEFMGPNYSIATACATANNSIIAASDHILRGEADLMIAGGSEAAIIPAGLGGFCACKALSQRNDAPESASRPWDKGRDGFVMGEGAGVIILEELEHALKRGAPIYAEYLGGGVSCDAYHMTEPRPDGEGIAECLKMALEHSGISPSDVSYINAHATSTPAGDMVEVRALKKIFSNPHKITMNATKSMIGHGLGASGGHEAIATIMAIKEGIVHPTINLEDPEPDLEFHIPTQAESLDIKTAISNSFGFGGHNATIVLAPYR
jgi:3-oxoacyl-[acyl-carrier-protein] synthase II